MLFLPMCFNGNRDILTCFKEVLKNPNVNLIMEQIKLQCLCSLEPKYASATNKVKAKLRELLDLNVDSK